jgi:hypothetical protein
MNLCFTRTLLLLLQFITPGVSFPAVSPMVMELVPLQLADEISDEEGLLGGTQIKTAYGYVGIEDLKENDAVMSYDLIDHSLREDRVVRIIRQDADIFMRISFNDGLIEAGMEQRFYALRDGVSAWMKARGLKSNDLVLMGSQKWCRITQVVEIRGKTHLYRISTLKYHNFFVDGQDILTHNFVVATGIAAGFKFTLSVATSLISCGVMWLYTRMTGKKIACELKIKQPNSNDWNHFLNNNRHDHGFNGKDPKKIWNFAEMMLLAAMQQDELKEGALYAVNGMTEYGVLEVTGKVLNGIVHIGTMYIKDIPK